MRLSPIKLFVIVFIISSAFFSCKKSDSSGGTTLTPTISTWALNDTTYTEGNFPTTVTDPDPSLPWPSTGVYVADVTTKNYIGVALGGTVPLANATYTLTRDEANQPLGMAFINVQTAAGWWYSTGRTTDQVTVTVRKLGKLTLTFSNIQMKRSSSSDTTLLSGTLIEE
jgi:hypothetical protein